MNLPTNKQLRDVIFANFNDWMASFNETTASILKTTSETRVNRYIIDFFKTVEVPAWEKVAETTLKALTNPLAGTIKKLNVVSSTLMDNATLLKLPGFLQVRDRIFGSFNWWKDQFVAFISKVRAARSRGAVISLKKTFMASVEVKAWDAVKDATIEYLKGFTMEVESTVMALTPHVEGFR
ncbi:MAG: hypothetical protein ACTSUE_12475 [Promethearchaeota archaeon]